MLVRTFGGRKMLFHLTSSLLCALVLIAAADCGAADLSTEIALLRKTVERLERKVDCKLEDGPNEDEVSTYFIGAGVPSSVPNSGVVEVFQLSSTDNKPDSVICRKRANIPFEEDHEVLTSPVAAHFGDHIMACGGSIHLEPINTCRTYNLTANSWSPPATSAKLRLLQVRYMAVSVMLGDGRWWILGGADEDNEPLKTTEMFDPTTEAFVPGPDLPVAASHHCFVRINSTHFFFTHGDVITKAAWLYSQPTKEWLPLPGTNRFRNRRSVCGYVERRGFGSRPLREVVVAGGAAESFAHRATEILDLDTLQWRQGPPLPDGFSNALVTPWKSTFLIFGGDNEIYEYVEELWILRSEKMRRKQAVFGSFLIKVPNEIC